MTFEIEVPNPWWRVLLPYACGAIVTEGPYVVQAAPIFDWMRGKRLETVADWVRKKGGTLTRLEER